MEEREAWYWLLNVPNIQANQIDKLISRYQNPLNILTARDLGSILSDEVLGHFEESIRRLDDYRRDYESLPSKNIRMILRGDKDYPEKLAGIPSEPYGLFVRGSLPDPDKKSVSIVGARRATHHGRWMATTLARDLSMEGIQIISGMALGIDGFSHQGALEAGGQTFAVLGTGVDVCYPTSHLGLYKDICETGGIISEYGLGVPGIAFHFPLRNRIISALADILVVVEARENSGSLITVTCALSQGREVMAVPGRPDDPYSEGCNRLIKEGAGLCASASDVIDQFEIEYSKILRWPFSNEGQVLLNHLHSDSFPTPNYPDSRKTSRSAPSKSVGKELQETTKVVMDENASSENGPRGHIDSSAKEKELLTTSAGEVGDGGESGSQRRKRSGRKSFHKQNTDDLDALEKLVYKNVGVEPAYIDDIAKSAGVPSNEVLGVLVALQIKGYVVSVTSGYYQLV